MITTTKKTTNHRAWRTSAKLPALDVVDNLEAASEHGVLHHVWSVWFPHTAIWPNEKRVVWREPCSCGAGPLPCLTLQLHNRIFLHAQPCSSSQLLISTRVHCRIKKKEQGGEEGEEEEGNETDKARSTLRLFPKRKVHSCLPSHCFFPVCFFPTPNHVCWKHEKQQQQQHPPASCCEDGWERKQQRQRREW